MSLGPWCPVTGQGLEGAAPWICGLPLWKLLDTPCVASRGQEVSIESALTLPLGKGKGLVFGGKGAPSEGRAIRRYWRVTSRLGSPKVMWMEHRKDPVEDMEESPVPPHSIAPVQETLHGCQPVTQEDGKESRISVQERV